MFSHSNTSGFASTPSFALPLIPAKACPLPVSMWKNASFFCVGWRVANLRLAAGRMCSIAVEDMADSIRVLVGWAALVAVMEIWSFVWWVVPASVLVLEAAAAGWESGSCDSIRDDSGLTEMNRGGIFGSNGYYSSLPRSSYTAIY